ncbi:MAG: hypothetical protein ACREM1_14295 [Longimicrobiales bacterium]
MIYVDSSVLLELYLGQKTGRAVRLETFDDRLTELATALGLR